MTQQAIFKAAAAGAELERLLHLCAEGDVTAAQLVAQAVVDERAAYAAFRVTAGGISWVN